MGKSAKLKKLRRIASQLPAIETGHIVCERVKGHQLIKEGVTQVQGKDVIGGDNYRRKKVEKSPLNHNRQMKKAYNRGGIANAIGYARAMVAHHKKELEKVEEK